MKKFLASLAVAAMAMTALLQADTLTLTDGSVLNGTLKSLADGTAVFETAFAGELKIATDLITKVDTANALNVAAADGKRLKGAIQIGEEPSSQDAIALPLSEIRFAWSDGMEDPTLPPPPPSRKWDGEVSMDIAGKTGNSEKFDGGIGVSANLTGPDDKLKLYANTAYARENHNTNTKKYLAGVDYERKFDGSAAWYVNGELEKQPTSGLRLREEVGAGLGYYLIEEEHTSLRLRAGVSGKSRKFTDGSHADGMGAEASLHFERDIQEWGKWVTDLTYQPTVDDIHDYRILHESALDIPILFKYPLSLRIGLSNEYNSRVATDAERMETSYFAKMVFKWK